MMKSRTKLQICRPMTKQPTNLKYIVSKDLYGNIDFFFHKANMKICKPDKI